MSEVEAEVVVPGCAPSTDHPSISIQHWHQTSAASADEKGVLEYHQAIDMMKVLVLTGLLTRTGALDNPSAALSRRGVLKAAPVGVALAMASPAVAEEVTACPKNANNCWSTASSDKTKLEAWSWPSGTSKSDVVASLKKAVDAYPQQGQAGVDLGGWSYAVDDLASAGYARLEFKSGIGNFAKFFNGGAPFVDDLELKIADGAVQVKSASRVGDSDLGVNAKRLNYIAAALRDQGWATGPDIVVK